MNVLRSMEEELCPLDVRRLEGGGGSGISHSEGGRGQGRGQRSRVRLYSVVGVLEDGDWDSEGG